MLCWGVARAPAQLHISEELAPHERPWTYGRLLSVVLEHLVAGLRKLFAVLLQASQDREVALIDHGATMPLHVTGASLLLVRVAPMLREGRRGERERRQGEYQEKSTHRIPSYREGVPGSHQSHRRDRCAANRERRKDAEAPVNAAKFTTVGSTFAALPRRA